MRWAAVALVLGLGGCVGQDPPACSEQERAPAAYAVALFEDAAAGLTPVPADDFAGTVIEVVNDLPSAGLPADVFPPPRKSLRVEEASGRSRWLVTAGAAVVDVPLEPGDALRISRVEESGQFSPTYGKLTLRDADDDILYWFLQGGEIRESFFEPGFAVELGEASCQIVGDCGAFARHALTVFTPDGRLDLQRGEQRRVGSYQARHIEASYEMTGASRCTDWFVSELAVVVQRP